MVKMNGTWVQVCRQHCRASAKVQLVGGTSVGALVTRTQEQLLAIGLKQKTVVSSKNVFEHLFALENQKKTLHQIV